MTNIIQKINKEFDESYESKILNEYGSLFYIAQKKFLNDALRRVLERQRDLYMQFPDGDVKLDGKFDTPMYLAPYPTELLKELDKQDEN